MQDIDPRTLVWALGSCCALHGKPFDADLLLKQHAPPYSTATLITASRALGFQAQMLKVAAAQLGAATSTTLLLLKASAEQPALGLLVSVDASASTITWIAAGTTDPTTQTLAEFNAHYSGQALLLQPNVEAVRDPDQAEHSAKSFGFRWFVPELLKHRKVWRDVLWASLVLQLLALGMSLFTQAIIDKVVVHQTESTLIVIAMGMAIFMVATAILTWVRQYLVLHTGNRVDAVLASTVFDHLFKLPPRYFQNRPTGVVAAPARRSCTWPPSWTKSATSVPWALSSAPPR